VKLEHIKEDSDKYITTYNSVLEYLNDPKSDSGSAKYSYMRKLMQGYEDPKAEVHSVIYITADLCSRFEFNSKYARNNEIIIGIPKTITSFGISMSDSIPDLYTSNMVSRNYRRSKVDVYDTEERKYIVHTYNEVVK